MIDELSPRILNGYLSVVLKRSDLPFQTRADCLERESENLVKLSQRCRLKAAISLERGEFLLEKYSFYNHLN